MKCDFIYENFNLSFDKNNMPILDNPLSIEDYRILRDFFLDKEIMKTSSAFCGETPSDKELDIFIYLLLNTGNKEFSLKKVYSNAQEEKTLIGLGGLILRKEKFSNLNTVEMAVFIKKEFQNSIYGYFISKGLLDSFDFTKGAVIASCREENLRTKKILLKTDFVFFETYEKRYKDKKFYVSFYIKSNNKNSNQTQQHSVENFQNFNLKTILLTNNI